MTGATTGLLETNDFPPNGESHVGTVLELKWRKCSQPNRHKH
jgi:hypothetical protein